MSPLDMKEPITVGVVGLGRAGWSIHVEDLRAREDFRIVAAADADAGRRAEAAEALGCATFEGIDGLLKESAAELVVVATPSFSHEADALKVLGAGRQCVLEKPMALDHAGARRLTQAAQEGRRRLFVHHQRRFSDEARFLREVIDSGVLGQVFELHFAWCRYARRNDWQTLRRNGGGELNNTATHLIDIALSLLDSPVEELLGDVRHVKDAGDADDHVHLFMKTRGGQNLDLVVSSCCAQTVPRTLLLGSAGTLLAWDDQTAQLRYFDPAEAPPLAVVEGPAPDRKYGNDDVLPWKEESREMKPSRTVGTFYDNVRAVLRDGAEVFVTPESAAEVVRIIERARGDGRTEG